MLTVDTEAQPARTARDPLEHLIWGRVEGVEAGIGRMMDVADGHGARLVFFLDYAEIDLYGDGLRDVAREIARRGHEVQLHFHPEFMDMARFERHGLPAARRAYAMTPEHARIAADFLIDEHISVCGRTPLGYRGGNYYVTDAILTALRVEGVLYSSNDTGPAGKLDLPRRSSAPFTWTNGVVEIPLASNRGLEGRRICQWYNFNSGFFFREKTAEDLVAKHREFLSLFDGIHRPPAPAVAVMHSWSLLKKGDDGKYLGADPFAVEAFEALVAALAGERRVVTFADLDPAAVAGPDVLTLPV